jgi:hypothetical protein
LSSTQGNDGERSEEERMSTVKVSELKAPPYKPASNADKGKKIGLVVESMKRHMTNEGWQIFEGLECNGYELHGFNIPIHNSTYVPTILKETNPSTLIIQDKREWDTRPGDFREQRARFFGVEKLRERTDIFKLTIFKDAHQRSQYHAAAATEMGCHAWIIYYHPDRVKEYSGFVRPQHMIRTYHTIDPLLVPEYGRHIRQGCLLSGAVSSAYPLRTMLFRYHNNLPDTQVLQHPGYHMRGCATPNFLKYLSTFKIAICTASVYGYALRKIIEATACGCVVITDLPEFDKLPEIDGNLCRIPSGSSVQFVADVIKRLIDEYNPERQKYFADCAMLYYDYKEETRRLADKIEALRRTYSSE